MSIETRGQRSPNACELLSSRPARTGLEASQPCTRSTTRGCLAASTDSVGTKLVARAAAWRPSRLRRRSRRPLHQRRDHLWRRAARAPRLCRREPHRPRAGRRARRRALLKPAVPPGVALHRGRDGRATRRVRGRRARLRGRRASARSRGIDVIDGSRVVAGDIVDRAPVRRGARERLHARSPRSSRTDDYDGPDLLAPTRLYLDDVRGLRGGAHAFAHVTGGGILGNLERVLPAGALARKSTGARGNARLSSAWLARARRRARAPTRVQPRDRLPPPSSPSPATDSSSGRSQSAR